MRVPVAKDAAKIWQIVNDSVVLDRNSAYLYLLLCRDFSDTCLVAVEQGDVVAFVTAYRPPAHPEVLFVWQVAVAEHGRGKGLGGKLLAELVRRQANLQFVEATISPSNEPSRRLFQSLARKLEATFEDLPNDGFTPAEFPTPGHEAEPRIRIGPLTTNGWSS